MGRADDHYDFARLEYSGSANDSSRQRRCIRKDCSLNFGSHTLYAFRGFRQGHQRLCVQRLGGLETSEASSFGRAGLQAGFIGRLSYLCHPGSVFPNANGNGGGLASS